MRDHYRGLYFSCLLAALLAAPHTAAAADYAAYFNQPTLDPGLQLHTIANATTMPVDVPGLSPPWSASTGSGYLALAKAATDAAQPSNDIAVVSTTFATGGDFIATAVADFSLNGAGRAGFFFFNNVGFTGMDFHGGELNQDGGGVFPPDGFAFTATATMTTLQLRRQGDTLSASYRPDGGAAFIQLFSITSSQIAGDAYFEVTNFANVSDAAEVRYASLTISSVPEPVGYGMLLGGLALLGLAARRGARGPGRIKKGK
ncbi:hypothetical protein [Rugamonas sp.]|uniref:hypothetical protein n=1 Tax=Rugamonas sp. TaxID=1926287 RepID=UPI0025DF5442|nr:hypothetical protein [Rugamonas sp.]